MVDRYVDGLEQAARESLPAPVFDYFRQGARDGATAAEAVEAWDRLRFLPRVLTDVTNVDVGTTLLGTDVSSPFGVAPTTLQRAAHPEGEVAMARAAAATGSMLVVSSNAGTTFEEIGATGAAWWLQMYVTPDREATCPVVERAVAAGARAIVLTADTPVVGTKYAPPVWDSIDPSWLRVNFADEQSDLDARREKATNLDPRDIGWLASRFGVPVVVKGVLRSDDARRCVDAGAAAVWVSNHGGRQLDRAAATPEVLPAVADEVGDQAEVYVDGGVRRGAHGLAAAALGARGVFLGRPPLYALADDGADGVVRALTELKDGLVEALRLAGCSRLEAVRRDLLHPRRACDRGHASPI